MSKPHRIPMSSKFLTTEKSYILGTLCGDGYVSTGYRIGLEVCDKEFADYFQSCLEKVYGLKGNRSERVRVKKKHYIVTLVSKAVVEDLLGYTFSFKSKEWKIPHQIKNSSRKIKAAFIKGFADSEGNVRFRRNGFGEIGLTSGNGNSLSSLQEMLLNDFGINSRFKIRKSKTVFVLYIGDYNSLVLFNINIGFVIKRKSYVLIMVLKSYKRGKLKIHSNEFKRKALSMLGRYGEHRFVAQLLNVSYTSVYDWQKSFGANEGLRDV